MREAAVTQLMPQKNCPTQAMIRMLFAQNDDSAVVRIPGTPPAVTASTFHATKSVVLDHEPVVKPVAGLLQGTYGYSAPEEASGAVAGEMALANAEPGMLSGEITSGEIGSGPAQGEPDRET